MTMNEDHTPGTIPCRDAFELRAAAAPVEQLGKRAGEALLGALGDHALLPNDAPESLFTELKSITVVQLVEVVGAVLGQTCIETSGGHAYGDPAKDWLTQEICSTVERGLR